MLLQHEMGERSVWENLNMQFICWEYLRLIQLKWSAGTINGQNPLEFLAFLRSLRDLGSQLDKGSGWFSKMDIFIKSFWRNFWVNKNLESSTNLKKIILRCAWAKIQQAACGEAKPSGFLEFLCPSRFSASTWCSSQSSIEMHFCLSRMIFIFDMNLPSTIQPGF